MPGAFLDTNILIYAFTADVRAEKAQALLESGCSISVQGLNEFTNVARRKLRMNWREIQEALTAIRAVCHVILPVDIETHSAALVLAERHKLAIFDALIVASAILSGCEILWSEDMQHGAVIGDRLRVLNPFRS